MDPDVDYAAPLRPMLDPLAGRRGPQLSARPTPGRWRPREVDTDLRDEIHKAIGKTTSPDFVTPPPMGRVLGAPPDMAMDRPPGVLSQGQAQGLAQGALEPLGQAGRLMTGRSQDVPGDLASVGAAMVPIGPPGAAAALKPTYSALGRAVAGLKQSAMHPEQWLGFLKNQPGVKAAEMEHVGLADWLKAHKGPVSRETIQELIGARQPDIQEIRKGARSPEYERALHETQKAFDEFHVTVRGTPEADAAMDRFHAATAEAEALKPGRSRFDEYQLPGGTNYGETLLTLPPQKLESSAANVADARRFLRGELNGDPTAHGFTTDDQVLGEAQRRGMIGQGQRDYHSTHWDEPNVLLHTRHNDRLIPDPNGPSYGPLGFGQTAKDAQGLNSLHMEELQSDWHQEGRKQGYKDNQPLTTRVAANDRYPGSEVHEALDSRGDVVGRGWNSEQAIENAQALAVPDAPFKQTWADLGLKHMLHRAATERNPNGSYKYDALSWTPGAAQNARYEGRGTAEEAGMAKFYDEILPNKANALVKSAGGRVQRAGIMMAPSAGAPGAGWRVYEGDRLIANQSTREGAMPFMREGRKLIGPPEHNVHVLRITPAVRAAAEKGFPTFAIGGAAALGAQQDNRQ